MGKKSKTVAWKDANKNNNDTSKEDTSSASANNNTVQPTETTQASSQAHGGCKGNDNCKGSNDHKGKKKKSNSHTPTMTFQGECKGLKDAIFDVSKRGQLDDCAEGIKRVDNHAAATYDCGGDVQQEIEEMRNSKSLCLKTCHLMHLTCKRKCKWNALKQLQKEKRD